MNYHALFEHFQKKQEMLEKLNQFEVEGWRELQLFTWNWWLLVTFLLLPFQHKLFQEEQGNRLSNEAEKSETRVNSRLAREINIALPRPLLNASHKVVTFCAFFSY